MVEQRTVLWLGSGPSYGCGADHPMVEERTILWLGSGPSGTRVKDHMLDEMLLPQTLLNREVAC